MRTNITNLNLKYIERLEFLLATGSELNKFTAGATTEPKVMNVDVT